MPRSDRLFDLIQILRDGQLHRGPVLAKRLNISLRTLYRDMATLTTSGIPVEGERGLGYMMSAPITLPPLNLTLEELEALHLGLAVVTKASDPAIQSAAQTLASKIDAVLPEDRSPPTKALGFATYPFEDAAHGFVHIAPARAAIRSRRKLDIAYATQTTLAKHTIRPLQIEYWGRLWTLTAWCETTQSFHSFRVDRITTLDVSFDSFEEESGKTLADYLASLEQPDA